MHEEMTKMLLDLQKSIGEIDKNQAVASEKIDAIKDDVADVKQDVKNVDSKVDNVSSQVSNLDQRLLKMENKKTIEDHAVNVSKFLWTNKVARYISIFVLVACLNTGLKHYNMPAIDVQKVLSFII